MFTSDIRRLGNTEQRFPTPPLCLSRAGVTLCFDLLAQSVHNLLVLRLGAYRDTNPLIQSV